MNKTHLILGSSAASMGVLSKLRTLDPSSRIICISASSEMPYNTCLLADYVAGIRDEGSLYTRPLSFFEKNNIELHLNTKVVDVNPSEKKITTSTSDEFFYDTLFIGTGTSIVPPPIPGLQQCTTWGKFHTLEDSKHLVRLIKSLSCKKVVIIGAGLSGVECADALSVHEIEVDIVDRKSHPLPFQIPQQGAALIIKRMNEKNVHFHGNTQVQEIRDKTIVLENGKELSYDYVVIATGGIPNHSFLKNVTLHDNAIVVNSLFETSLADIYAAGDVAAVPDLITQQPIRNNSWPDAMIQGMHAAHSMAGIKKQYPGFFALSGSRFFGTQFVSCGPIASPPEGAQLHEELNDNSYKAFLLHGNHLIGFVMIGTLTTISHYKSLIISKQPCTLESLKQIA